jgi:hypothetical protein
VRENEIDLVKARLLLIIMVSDGTYKTVPNEFELGCEAIDSQPKDASGKYDCRCELKGIIRNGQGKHGEDGHVENGCMESNL